MPNGAVRGKAEQAQASGQPILLREAGAPLRRPPRRRGREEHFKMKTPKHAATEMALHRARL
jgi:hypothetical protein